jgi:hypothetical protein
MERCAGILRQCGPISVEAGRDGDEIPDSSPPLLVPGGLVLLDSEKAEAIADSLEAQFQPVNDPSSPEFIQVVNEVMRAYEYASEPKLTSPSEVLESKGLKAGKAPGPNGVPYRALEHLPKRAITFLTELFNAVLQRLYISSAWKHARVVSILKPGKEPTLHSSYKPISLLDAVGVENIPLARVLREVNELGLLRDEQFGIRHRHSSWAAWMKV